tara:strand:- start:464 stop:571 length:108 start_codon:yes stop_codon:yes gene_type:complete
MIINIIALNAVTKQLAIHGSVQPARVGKNLDQLIL